MTTIRHEPGGDKKRLESLIKQVNGLEVKAGWFSDQVYEDGTKLAHVAQWQEFGTAHIPPRPFIRTTEAREQRAWSAKFNAMSKLMLAGTLQPMAAMQMFGEGIAGDIRKTISQIWNPPLARSTVLARLRRYSKYQNAGKKGRARMRGNIPPGVAKPLVDTGVLLASVTSQVGRSE